MPPFALFDDLAEFRKVLGQAGASDEALTTFLLDAEAQILQAGGALGELVEVRSGGSRIVILSRIAAEVTAAREGRVQPIELDAEDYRLNADGRSIERLEDGPNPGIRWRDPAEIEFTAFDDLQTRRATAVALVRAALTGQPGVLGFSEGNFAIQFANGATWSSTREDVLESVGPLWNFG